MNGRFSSPRRPAPGPLCAVYALLLPLLGTQALAPEEEESVREHLADCAWCQHQVTSYTAAEEALRRHYSSAPASKSLTLEDIMRSSEYDTRPVRLTRPNDRDDLRNINLPDQSDSGWRSSRPGGGAARGRGPWRALGAVAAVVLLVGVAAAIFAALRPQIPQTPGGTPAASCAAVLPGASAAASINGFPAVTFPAGAVMTAPSSTQGGPSQFTLLSSDVCYSGTAEDVTGPASAHQSVTAKLLGAGWAQSSTFPSGGDVLQPCASQCYQRDNTHYLALQGITDHSHGVFTYHLQLAAPPAAPTCNLNFANSPIKGVQASVDGVPLPPITYVVPDDAMNLRGYDLCSSGTAGSVTAFLTKALPADGWTKGSDPHCFYSNECWTKGSNAISWNVADPADWQIAYHPNVG